MNIVPHISQKHGFFFPLFPENMSLRVTIHSLRVRGVFACVFSCKNPSKTAFAHARRAFGMGKRKLLSQFRRDCE